MSRITGLSLAVLAMAGMAFMGGGKPRWMKFDRACSTAPLANGMPIAVYATVDATGAGC